MYQTDNIEDLASNLGIDSGTSSNSADRMRKIAETVGMEHYNSLYDNDKLEDRLKELAHEKNPNVPHFDARGNTPNINNNKNFASALARNKLNNRNSNNSPMTNKLASKGLQSAGVPKGASDRIVNSGLGQRAIDNMKKRHPMLNLFDRLTGGKNKEIEEQASDGGLANLRTSFKVVKRGLIACAFAMPIIIFACLLTNASQIFINSIGLGHADSLSGQDVEDKINKKENDEDALNRQITDDNADKPANGNNNNETGYDYFIDDENSIKFRNNKLDEHNLVEIANVTRYLKRKYSEATLDQLEDFYPEVVRYAKENDTDTVYDFFFKLYYVYQTYRDDYGVNLDLPLLMATLDKQSSDKTIVFSSNLSDEDKKKSKRPKSDFGYCKDWSGYTTSKDKSEHDIEVLAQHMVSEQVTEYCKNSSGENTQENILRDDEIGKTTLTCAEGETYGTTSPEMKLDNDKYKEFLKEFIEKKYYLKEEKPLSTSYSSKCGISKSSNNPSTSYSGASNLFAAAMVDLANKEYNEKQGYDDGIKYINAYGGFAPHTPWCVIFVWYISANTKVNGRSLYPDIIKEKYAGTLTYMKYFNNSADPNINFYYNDNCSNLKGKNGDINYTPKPGDYIFFDWEASFYDLSSGTQDHTAMVEKYENGYIYTIEGNSGNDLAKRKYPISSCQVIGFGSWY